MVKYQRKKYFGKQKFRHRARLTALLSAEIFLIRWWKYNPFEMSRCLEDVVQQFTNTATSEVDINNIVEKLSHLLVAGGTIKWALSESLEVSMIFISSRIFVLFLIEQSSYITKVELPKFKDRLDEFFWLWSNGGDQLMTQDTCWMYNTLNGVLQHQCNVGHWI